MAPVLWSGMVPKLIDCGLSIVVPESVKTTFTMTSVTGTQGIACLLSSAYSGWCLPSVALALQPSLLRLCPLAFICPCVSL